MTSFFIFPLLTLLIALLQPTNAFGAPSPISHIHLHHNRGSYPIVDPTSIRHSSSQIHAFLLGHNIIRAQHNVNPLKWSTPLAEMAEQWADACNFKHTKGVLSDTPYGENIVAATGDFPVSAAVATFVKDASEF